MRNQVYPILINFGFTLNSYKSMYIFFHLLCVFVCFCICVCLSMFFSTKSFDKSLGKLIDILQQTLSKWIFFFPCRKVNSTSRSWFPSLFTPILLFYDILKTASETRKQPWWNYTALMHFFIEFNHSYHHLLSHKQNTYKTCNVNDHISLISCD